ncbi:cytochrome b/b6 domain-containing protein [Chitinophaga agrisoli]|uniref:Cytochrome b/b6 domain-containing protein n=1 Tax=Chitinophaga agrisoli TaxID=2607653 RepID=A0A5B2VHZ0_9BACT|nr:cytochrome b/b6 domain-containing protein [Chitinophaga agrisoli]KAA2239203.1 cytochrome b/b6 domain-containing protein [Chitinophaga agrisoli]
MREKRFNLVHRVLHWAIAFTILFLLLTVLLRMGWMNKDGVGEIIRQQLDKSGTDLSSKDAGLIGKAVRLPMWKWHYVAGYVMIGLYLIRMVVMLVQGVAYEHPFKKGLSATVRFKGWTYVVFYVLLAASLFTGMMSLYGPKSWHHGMSVVHIKSLYYVATFIILHIGGVLIADAGAERGIISKIISGDGPVDNGAGAVVSRDKAA